MQRREFKAGDIVIRIGDRGDSAFFILSGAVEVFIERDGTHTTLSRLGKGEIFGELALIDPGPRSATVRAVEPTICIVTSYDDFRQSLKDNPDLAYEFLKTLVGRLREANARIAELSGNRDQGLRKLLQPYDRDRIALV
jgi:CRP-like cAMP-binding protein